MLEQAIARSEFPVLLDRLDQVVLEVLGDVFQLLPNLFFGATWELFGRDPFVAAFGSSDW